MALVKAVVPELAANSAQLQFSSEVSNMVASVIEHLTLSHSLTESGDFLKAFSA